MTKVLSTCVFLLVSILCVHNAHALQLSRNLPTSARDFEFYYEHHNLKSLSSMLRTFDREHSFMHGEMRLITAAFLAEIFKKEPAFAKEILLKASEYSHDFQRMLLWACHFSQKETLRTLNPNLRAEKSLELQIAHSPEDITQWEPCQSPTSIKMLWGAYFADAEERFLSCIVDFALLHVTMRELGKTHDPCYQKSMDCAALLYEMTDRHEKVHAYLQKLLPTLSDAKAKAVRLLLHEEDD